MTKKIYTQLNHVEKTVNIQWCVSKVFQYMYLSVWFQLNTSGLGGRFPVAAVDVHVYRLVFSEMQLL